MVQNYTVKGENVRKGIRMGDHYIKILRLSFGRCVEGCKSSVLWSQIAFYGSAGALPKPQLPIIKLAVYLYK